MFPRPKLLPPRPNPSKEAEEENMSEREDYEKDLARRQQEHLRNVQGERDYNWQPCLHDGCPDCCGTGIKRDGTGCIHMISCPCPKCSPRF